MLFPPLPTSFTRHTTQHPSSPPYPQPPNPNSLGLYPLTKAAKLGSRDNGLGFSSSCGQMEHDQKHMTTVIICLWLTFWFSLFWFVIVLQLISGLWRCFCITLPTYVKHLWHYENKPYRDIDTQMKLLTRRMCFKLEHVLSVIVPELHTSGQVLSYTRT